MSEDDIWPKWYDPIDIEIPTCDCAQGHGQKHCHPDSNLLAPIWAVPNYCTSYVFSILPRPRQCRWCDMYDHFAMAYYKQGLYWECERCHMWINGVTDDLRDRN